MRTVYGYRPLGVVADLAGVGLVAALLAAIHFLVPARVQEGFVFRRSLARPETLLSSAYLHLSDGHLYGNLAGYLSVALFAYLLCLAAGERRWFRFTALSFLTLLPVLVNLTSMALWETLYAGVDVPPSRGFSGVAAGFGGFLAVALLVFLRTAYSRSTVRLVGQFVLLAVLAELLVVHVDSPPMIGGALVLLGVGLVAVGIGYQAYPEGVPDDRRDWFVLAGMAGVTLSVLAVLLTLVYGLFPERLVDDGTLTNVFAHLSGLVWGVVVARWGYRYWRRTPPPP